MDQGKSQRSNERGNYDSFKKNTETSPYAHALRSPSYEEALRIEQRHEELKKQIALKEKQLADMTGERESVNILRNRLGLDKSMNADISNSSIIDSRKQFSNMDSARRGLYSSVSPDHHSQIIPNMAGMKSTTLGNNRGISHEKTAQPLRDNSMHDKRVQPTNQSLNQQQLQFHPTRIPARPVEQYNSNVRSSPLRSKSRSKSRHDDDSYLYNPMDQSRRNEISPYKGSRAQQSSNSPLRKSSPVYPSQNHQIIEEAVESSENMGESEQSNYHLKPQKVQPLRQSGQPPNINTGTSNLQYATSFSNDLLGQPINNNSLYTQQTSQNLPGGQEPRDKLYRERIEAMTLDNQSLQRRLNQVSSELDRIHRENEDLVRQMDLTDGDVNRINSLLNNKNDVDAQNNILQADLERIKDVNLDLGNKLREQELESANVGTKLSNTQVQKKNTEIEYDNINHDFSHKIQSYEDISRDRVMNLQKLNNVNNELEQLNREQLQNNHDNIDMEGHVLRLHNERRDLLANIERTTIKFDDAVHDLGRNRSSTDQDNDWHTKLIVTKNIFVALELFAKQRKQHVFNEINKYCEFDGDCHVKLRRLSNTMLRVGQYKMRTSLNQWYDKSLRPLKTREQNDDISIVIDCNRLTAKVFYAWRQYQRDKMDTYHFKTNAIERIWHRLEMDAKQEKKRALDIWKQKKGFQVHTMKFLKRVMRKRELRHCEQALFALKDHSSRLEYACRVQVLHRGFTNKIFLSQVFTQMKQCVRIEKQNRIRTLNSFLKAWQDYVSYNRHLMQTNMAAIAFRENNTHYTLRAVFQGLRQHTESTKYALLDHAVKNDMNVAIEETSNYNSTKTKKLLSSNQLRAGNITRDMIGKRLFSYFQKWKKESDHFRVSMDTTVKNRILRTYTLLMRSNFDQWKKRSFDKVRRKKMQMVQDLQMSQEASTNDALVGEKNLRVRAEQVRTSQRKMVDKTFRKLFYRNLQYAINVWKDKCNSYVDKESKATIVLKKMRNRFLRQAFDRYLKFNKRSIQHSKNLLRGDHIAETIRLRELRKMYNALCYYTQWQLRIKKIWSKVLYRFDYFQKQRAMKRWSDNGNEKQHKRLMFTQDEMTNDISNLNEELQDFQITEHKQKEAVKSQNKNLSRKGYRQIGNTFQRLYTNQTQQKFNIWKAKVRETIHKEKVIKRTIDHYNKRYLEGIQRVFVKFLSDDRRREYLESIKHTDVECHDITLWINQNRQTQDVLREKKLQESMQTTGESQETERKVLHTMHWMENMNQRCVFRARKRMIFEMWRHVGQQEKAFLYCIKNVLTKSMYKNGLEHINRFARNDDYTDKVQRAMKRWSMKSARTNLGDGFNKWKKMALTKVDDNSSKVTSLLKEQNDAFDEFRKKTQKQNLQRVMGYFVEKDKQNIFRGLYNATKHLKLVKSKHAEFNQRQTELRQEFALKRWRSRVQKTRECRNRNDQLVHAFQLKYRYGGFRKWKQHYLNVKRFVNSLHNLENLMRTKIVGDSFKGIHSFSESKRMIVGIRHKKGGEDFKNILYALYLKKLGLSFQKYKNNTGGNSEKNSVLKTMLGKFSTIRVRDAFMWWKKRHELKELKADLHDAGPVRAQYWLAMKEIDNLKDFMKGEHYTDLEINKFVNDVSQQNEFLMKKYMTRLMIRQNKDRSILPIVLDRWKGLVSLRKLLKYQFNFCSNQVENEKADVQRAWNKWKRGPNQLETELWRLPIKTLSQLGLKTTNELSECSDQIAENQSINNHLVMQRDEFLNYYIKGQILAMALVKDRTTFAQMQGLSRWLRVKKHEEKSIKLRDIRDASYLYANLQDREIHLNKENENFEQENAEMKQFTKDGVIIKANMERLRDERDRIADTIAGTEDDYQELMEQNAKLQVAVQAEEGIVNENQLQGIQSKFLADFKSLKDPPSLPGKIATSPKETEVQKQKRLKMERLALLNQNGSKLR